MKPIFDESLKLSLILKTGYNTLFCTYRVRKIEVTFSGNLFNWYFLLQISYFTMICTYKVMKTEATF